MSEPMKPLRKSLPAPPSRLLLSPGSPEQRVVAFAGLHDLDVVERVAEAGARSRIAGEIDADVDVTFGVIGGIASADAVEVVGAGAAAQHVIAIVARQGVVAVAAHQHVVAGVTNQKVVAC